MSDLKERAREVLLRNFEATGGRYICPSWPYYPYQWFWDSCFHAIACSHLDMKDMAKNEITRLLNAQDARGFIPRRVYARKFQWYNWRDWKDWERIFSKGWLPSGISTTGTPVLAQAVRAIGDRQFFLSHADQIIKFYSYFANVRDPDGDGLISLITPREGGRDSSPEYDFYRLVRVPPPFKFLDSAIDQVSLALLKLRWKLLGWDERKILERNIFNVQDLAFQCIWLDGLYDLEWMLLHWGGGYKQYPELQVTIQKAEGGILTKCWNAADQTFYSLRNGKTQLQVETIASLFPLLVRTLPRDQKEAIIAALCDESRFNVPYPVPSVSISHREFRPSRTFLIWRGSTSINTNWFLIRGLMRQGEKYIAERICERSIEMVQKWGFREFYHPYTGEGFRVRNFGWSTLIVTFENIVSEPLSLLTKE